VPESSFVENRRILTHEPLFRNLFKQRIFPCFLMFIKQNIQEKRGKFFARKLVQVIPQGGNLLLVGDRSLDLVSKLPLDYCKVSVLWTENVPKNFPFEKVFDFPLGEFGLKDCIYDAIIIFDVLSHLERPRQLIEQFYAALKDGGVMYVSVPNLSFKKYKKLPSILTEEGHVILFDTRKWKYLFEMNSLVVEKQFTESNLKGILALTLYLPYSFKIPFFPNGSTWYFLLRKSKEGCRRNPDFLEDPIKI